MSNQKKSKKKQIKYFTPGDDKDTLYLLFPNIEAMKHFHSLIGTILNHDPVFEPEALGRYFSHSGTFKDSHP